MTPCCLKWHRNSHAAKWSVGFRAGWSSARGRWGTAQFSGIAQSHDADDDEPEDQIPRVFPPLCAGGQGENAAEWFDLEHDSPYMLLVASVHADKRVALHDDERKLRGLDLLKAARSEIPAVTHVDYSARVQTVHKSTNPRFYKLLDCFEKQTGCPMLINTSFNVRGEPIVCTPEDTWRCFMHTEIDCLALGNCLLIKTDQDAAAVEQMPGTEFEPG